MSIILENLKIVGAGGNGIVYLMPNGNIIKFIKYANDCTIAEKELEKQKKIYDSFSKIKGIKILALDKIMISKPLESVSKNVIINYDIYSCYFTMKRLYGISYNIYKEYDNNIDKYFDNEYIENENHNFDIMLHLTFNSSLMHKIYGISFSTIKIGYRNPLRGYFISENDTSILDFLRNNYNLSLTNEELKEMVGFIYGWIFYEVKYVPIDIEITLGYDINTNAYNINVLDFGMTFDYTKIDIPRDMKYDIIYNKLMEYNKSSSSTNIIDKINFIESEVKYLISLDLYGNIEDDNDVLKGWNMAKNMVLTKDSNIKMGGTNAVEFPKQFNDINTHKDTYEKYIKYKIKYLNLKNLIYH